MLIWQLLDITKSQKSPLTRYKNQTASKQNKKKRKKHETTHATKTENQIQKDEREEKRDMKHTWDIQR